MPTSSDAAPEDTPEPLITQMRGWDRKSAATIKMIYDRHCNTDAFVPTLIAASAVDETACAATWLIKHHCEQEARPLSHEMCAQIYAQLPHFSSWDAQLHVLQSMDHLPVPASSAPLVFDCVRAGATAPKTLIRAWSLYCAAVLARQYPDYTAQVRTLLDDAAMDRPKGAVAVRLRKAQALLS